MNIFERKKGLQPETISTVLLRMLMIMMLTCGHANHTTFTLDSLRHCSLLRLAEILDLHDTMAWYSYHGGSWYSDSCSAGEEDDYDPRGWQCFQKYLQQWGWSHRHCHDYCHQCSLFELSSSYASYSYSCSYSRSYEDGRDESDDCDDGLGPNLHHRPPLYQICYYYF